MVSRSMPRGRGSVTSTDRATWPGRPVITCTRSDSSTASSTSWVTKRMVLRSCSQISSSQGLHAPAGQRVQRAERLVEEHHVAPGQERAQQRGALAHATGEVARPAALEASRPKRPEFAGGPGACLATWASRRGRGPARCCRAPTSTASAGRAGACSRPCRAASGGPGRRAGPSPCVGAVSPARMLNSVDLPQPLGPRIETKLPLADLEVDVGQGDDLLVLPGATREGLAEAFCVELAHLSPSAGTDWSRSASG